MDDFFTTYVDFNDFAFLFDFYNFVLFVDFVNFVNFIGRCLIVSMIFRVTTPSVDSGNPSASNNSPTRQENGHAINIEHAENFEADMALITQKIDTLRKSSNSARNSIGKWPFKVEDLLTSYKSFLENSSFILEHMVVYQSPELP